jgi:hypothetical protein
MVIGIRDDIASLISVAVWLSALGYITLAGLSLLPAGSTSPRDFAAAGFYVTCLKIFLGDASETVSPSLFYPFQLGKICIIRRRESLSS